MPGRPSAVNAARSRRASATTLHNGALAPEQGDAPADRCPDPLPADFTLPCVGPRIGLTDTDTPDLAGVATAGSHRVLFKGRPSQASRWPPNS